jgi:hypothetical protein
LVRFCLGTVASLNWPRAPQNDEQYRGNGDQ